MRPHEPPLTDREVKALCRLLRDRYGTHAQVGPRGRIDLPGWVLESLRAAPGERVQLVVVEDLLALARCAERNFPRAELLDDGSIRLPTVVLAAAARGPLVFEHLPGPAFRLRLLHAGPGEGEVSGAGAVSFPAPISAVGRLLLPATVIGSMGAKAGDAIVFGPREGGIFEVQTQASLERRVAADLRDLLAAATPGAELAEGRRAAAREAEVADPLAGSWSPAGSGGPR